jgi:hypothetical protein
VGESSTRELREAAAIAQNDRPRKPRQEVGLCEPRGPSRAYLIPTPPSAPEALDALTMSRGAALLPRDCWTKLRRAARHSRLRSWCGVDSGASTGVGAPALPRPRGLRRRWDAIRAPVVATVVPHPASMRGRRHVLEPPPKQREEQHARELKPQSEQIDERHATTIATRAWGVRCCDGAAGATATIAVLTSLPTGELRAPQDPPGAERWTEPRIVKGVGPKRPGDLGASEDGLLQDRPEAVDAPSGRPTGCLPAIGFGKACC